MRVLRHARSYRSGSIFSPDKRLPDCEGIETSGDCGQNNEVSAVPDKRLPDCEGIET